MPSWEPGVRRRARCGSIDTPRRWSRGYTWALFPRIAMALDTLKPGQSVVCTVVKAPRTEDRQQTIMRLMRKDSAIGRGLRKAQRRRRQNMVIYNRGNRDWVKRETVGKIARVADGQSWTMVYTPDLAADLRAVESYLKIKPA